MTTSGNYWDRMPEPFHKPLQAYLRGSITAAEAQAKVDEIAMQSAELRSHRDRFLADVEESFRTEDLSPH